MAETIDTDRFTAAARSIQRSTGPKCGAGQLSPEGRTLIEAGLAAGIQIKAICTTLRDPSVGTGERVSPDQIARHYTRRECQCWDD